jgi:superoxide dismutase
MNRYVWPDLGYDYCALEPHCSTRMLELHHDKHHKAYVDGVNVTLDKLTAAHAAADLTTNARTDGLSKSLGPRLLEAAAIRLRPLARRSFSGWIVQESTRHPDRIESTHAGQARD